MLFAVLTQVNIYVPTEDPRRKGLLEAQIKLFWYDS